MAPPPQAAPNSNNPRPIRDRNQDHYIRSKICKLATTLPELCMLWSVESAAVRFIPESADDEARIRRPTIGLRKIIGPFRVFDMDMRQHPTLGMAAGCLA